MTTTTISVRGVHHATAIERVMLAAARTIENRILDRVARRDAKRESSALMRIAAEQHRRSHREAAASALHRSGFPRV